MESEIDIMIIENELPTEDEDEEFDFEEWWNNLDDIEREEYNHLYDSERDADRLLSEEK